MNFLFFKILLIMSIFFTNVQAMGTPPDSIQKKYGHKVTLGNIQKEETKKTPLNPKAEILTQVKVGKNKGKKNQLNQNIFAPKQSEEKDNNKNLNKKIKKKIKNLINQNKYTELTKLLTENKQYLNEDQDTTLLNLEIFSSIDKGKEKYEQQFGKSKEINSNKVIRFINEAKKNILLSNNTTAKLFLIQTLYVDKSNFTAKEILKRNLNLSPDEYTIQNIELKQWRESEINFLSNNFGKAVNNLNILSVFDPNNSIIYERLGANYYSLSKMDEAINAWTIALNIDPKNKIVRDAISTAKQVKIEQEKEYEQYLKKKESTKKKVNLPNKKDTILLSVFYDRAEAIKFLNKSEKNNKKAKIYLYETDKGNIEIRMLKNKEK